MNEDGIIIAYWLTESKRLEVIRADMIRVFRSNPLQDPQVFYTDLCFSEGSFLQDVFPTLKPQHSSDRLKFTEQIIETANFEIINTICADFRKRSCWS